MPPWKEKWANVLIVYGFTAYMVITISTLVESILSIAVLWVTVQFNDFVLGAQ